MIEAAEQVRVQSSVRPLFTLNHLGSAIGAELVGLDLTRRVDDVTFAAIRAALLEHQMICIRGQEAVTPQDQLEFAQRWGTVSVHPYVPSIDGYPGIMKVYDPHPITQTWHADTTHLREPPAITLLLARVLPPIGGDTMFASAVNAFELLSEGLRKTLLGLKAVHMGTELASTAGLDQAAVTAVHPVVRTHPETGRKAIFVNGNYVKNFEGWSAADSAPLLAHLYACIGRYENAYRHRWRSGDLVIWDNRSAQHAVVGDTGGAERVLHRVTIAGDEPY
jgi:taurine dioxygenase